MRGTMTMDDILVKLCDAGLVYITENQVSEITGLALQTLRNDRCQGKRLPYRKIGRSIRYRLDEVFAYIEAHRVDVENL
jgi:hypothetical protein